MFYPPLLLKSNHIIKKSFWTSKSIFKWSNEKSNNQRRNLKLNVRSNLRCTVVVRLCCGPREWLICIMVI